MSTVSDYDGPADGQAEAGTAGVPFGAGSIDPIKPFNHVREVLGGNADARVVDLNDSATVLAGKRYTHTARCGPVLDCVVYQIRDDLSNASAVADHVHRLRA